MLRLAYRNLFVRKVRTGLTALAIALEVALVVLLIGLTNGTLRDAGKRIENIESDIIVLPPGSQFVLGMSTAVMPLGPVKGALESTADVLGAAPVVFTSTNAFGSVGLVFGIDPASYSLMGRGALDIATGRGLEAPDDIVVDTRLAQANRLKVGQTVELLNHTFKVAGIAHEGAGVRMYVPIATLQDLIGRRNKASLFFVRVAREDRVGAVLDRLRRTPAFKGYNIVPSAEYADLLASSTVGVREFNTAITLVAVLFGFIAIALSMYTTIVERTRQIGVLKSMGASSLFIVAEVVFEAGLLAGIGYPVGLAIAALAKLGLGAAYPTLIINFTAPWFGWAALLALASAVLGALWPALRAARVDPVVALSHL